MVIIDEYGEKDRIKSDNAIPDYDHSKVPFYYDYYDKEWVYKKPDDDGPNGVDKKVDTDRIINEKLVRGIKGYKKDNYWGEDHEFDHGDDEDDDD